MDTKKLRQKILDLAIRGKLVPQDPNDEPASVLLERIRAEKEQLIKEGKIKRSKKSAATDKSHYENVPFEIPESWVLSDFSELVTLLSGRDLESNDCNSNREGIPYLIGASNIVDGKINITRWTTKPLVISKRGDILISCKGTIGEVVTNVIGEIHIARQFMAIQTLPMVYADYIELYIKSIVNNIKRNARGVIPGISREDILHREIALPPLEEQKRIVIEVEKWLDFIAEIEVGKAELESYIKQTKSKILDLAISGKLVPQDPDDESAIELLKRINPGFKPCDNSHYENLPENWCLAKVKDVFAINPRNKAEDNTIAGFIPMTLIDDGYSNTFSYEKRKWGSIKTGFTHFADGDVAVAKISPCLENRKSIVLRDLPNGIGAGTTELHVFRSSVVVPEYALYFFKSEYFISKCVGTFNGVVGQQRVGKNIIEEIQIPIPPINEQKKIVSTIETIFTQLNTITAEL